MSDSRSGIVKYKIKDILDKIILVSWQSLFKSLKKNLSLSFLVMFNKFPNKGIAFTVRYFQQIYSLFDMFQWNRKIYTAMRNFKIIFKYFLSDYWNNFNFYILTIIDGFEGYIQFIFNRIIIANICEVIFAGFFNW